MISLFSLIAAAAAGVLAVFVVLREPKSTANRLFGVGMLLLAVEGGLVAMVEQAVLPGDALRWQQWRLVTVALGTAVWLSFSVAYSRANYQEFLRRWRFVLGVGFGVPILVTLGSPGGFYQGLHRPGGEAHLSFTLGRSGFLLHLCILLGTVLALANLERTFRASVGTMRWRIKLVVLGLGTVLAAQIYASSEAVLNRADQLTVSGVTAAASIVGCLLIGFSLYRTGRFNLDLYPSTTLLHRSLVVLLAGGYLVLVGVLAKLVTWLGGDSSGPLPQLSVLIALVLLALISFSDHAQAFLRRFVSRHLRRPHYDYERSWSEYTSQLAGQTTAAGVCKAAVQWLSGTFELLSSSLWLVDDQRGQLEFGASTSISSDTAILLDRRQLNLRPALEAIKRQPEPVDLEREDVEWAKALRALHPTFFPDKGGSRLAVPLMAAGELVGLLALGDRVGGREWTTEDLELLGCVARQTASVLLNLRLATRLADSRETEALQTMATFFAHDLKNTSNTLSLMLENLPRHFDNPEFRTDALRAIERSVDRINQLGAELGLLRRRVELKPQPTDLTELARRVAGELQRARGLPLVLNLAPVPAVALDPEQFEKVITNLVVNAAEAIGTDGWIRITTAVREGQVWLTVEDNGHGMTPEFIRTSLFRPFQTTKKKGIGIGLYHVRTLVEAHRGWVEVESEPGKGSVFRVVVPVAGAEGLSA